MGDKYNSYEDDLLNEISKSIAQQVNAEFEDDIHTTDKKEIDGNVGKQPKKNKIPTWGKVLLGLVSTLLVIIIGVGCYGWYILGGYNFKSLDPNNVQYQEEQFDVDENSEYDEMNPEDVKWLNSGEAKKVEGVHNILLVAEEKTDGSLRGRTDVNMIATIDTINKSLKLTSIMRDTYVQIPGFKANRVNTAYRSGDVPLLMKVVEENFDVELDGYVLVDFDSFANVIDALGGVEITLTEEEAEYLRETNYIADEDQRTVVAGTQILNGGQAVGYSRVRYVQTAEGKRDDFGRIQRQKNVLNAIFNKYKSQSLPQLIGLMDDVLGLVTTNLKRTDLLSYAATVVSMGATELETFSVPVAGGFENKTINKMAVLVPDFEVCNAALHDFIFGTNETEQLEAETTPTATPKTTTTKTQTTNKK